MFYAFYSNLLIKKMECPQSWLRDDREIARQRALFRRRLDVIRDVKRHGIRRLNWNRVSQVPTIPSESW